MSSFCCRSQFGEKPKGRCTRSTTNLSLPESATQPVVGGDQKARTTRPTVVCGIATPLGGTSMKSLAVVTAPALLTSGLSATIALLRQAHAFAQENGRDVWDFAVEIDLLRQTGATP